MTGNFLTNRKSTTKINLLNKRNIFPDLWRFLSILSMINLVVAQKLMTTDLNQGNGFTIIETGEMSLIQNYSKILHIFKTDKYTTYLEELEMRTKLLNDEYLNHQLRHVRRQLSSIVPRHRQTRGLINILGTGLKYIYGR